MSRAVVVGYGNVGRLLARMLADAGWETAAWDRCAEPEAAGAGRPGAVAGAEGRPVPRPRSADVTAPTAGQRAELARADVVFLAVPEQAALAALDVLESALAPHATVVETLSHKHRFLDAADRRLAPRALLSLNPLFHPSLGWADNAVTASVLRPDARCAQVLRLISATGARVVRLSHEEHDRHVTAVQAATHAALLAFTRALARLGVRAPTVADCAPPPTRALLALAARVLSADVETYWDIQAAGGEATAARDAVAAALADLSERTTAPTGGEKAFRQLFEEVADWFGEGRATAADDAARMLQALIATGPPSPVGTAPPSHDTHTAHPPRRPS
ncbi:prephenate dehydrogenase/arogenate dehydrogenase family protein [Streptomyces sp. NWU49]|uniref:2-dehydropantoate 2-reductase N-terminal domain-containing protein n=1 Tax=Streptomyces sp. NWU49 TaxID=2201153 RepID=UPI000D67F2D3|nr:2-dehydropantoate 2-reductase N-terminal domain-containing protein [Streptomyces sp. NWU49]PWJ02703.1 prephenate dehydrogenase/arogenate dehydrogenase family protein [Streptomyces sp. NWU49]